MGNNEVGKGAIKEHSLRKLSMIEKYLYIATTIFKKQQKKMCLVETHAGIGIERDKKGEVVEGSAYIGARKLGEYLCIFMEGKTERRKELKENLSGFQNVKIYSEGSDEDYDSNEHFGTVLDGIPQNTFIVGVFDPYGPGDLKWSTIEALGKKWSDAIINFPYLGIKYQYGWIEQGKECQGITDFFGTDEWKEIVRKRIQKILSPKEAEQSLLDLYKNRLKKHWAYTPTIPVTRGLTRSAPTIYHMIFATNHLAVNNAMASVLRKLEKQKPRDLRKDPKMKPLDEYCTNQDRKITDF